VKKFTYDYPHPAVATDIAIFTLKDGRLALLLIQRGEQPFKGCWALPGGFLREDETLDDCARRELLEETGVGTERLWSFGNFSRPDRDPRQRVISVAYLALLRFETLNVAVGSDAVGAGWFGLDELPRLAFDHDEIVEQELKSLRNRNDLSVLFALLPERFTLSAAEQL
jgi:8-oxo-dGTP diphosphatase